MATWLLVLASQSAAAVRRRSPSLSARTQGLTLVHLSAQRERFLWYRGCVEGLFRGYQGVQGGV